MADDLGSQLKAQLEINKALRERAGYLRQQSQLLSQQASLAQQMCDAVGCVDFSKIASDAENLKEGLNEVADKAAASTDALSGLEEAADDAGDSMEGMTKKGMLIGAVAGGVRGFMGSLKMSFGILSGFGKIVKNVIGSVLNLGMSIISLPFKMLTGLIKMSQKGGIDPLRVALEEVKDVMGDIASNEGKMLASTVTNMRTQMSDMAGTGLSMSRVFGYGREGMAKFLKENLELAGKVGIGFGNLRDEFAQNSVALAMYRKGLGITNDQQAIMIRLAKARGKSMIEEQTAFASMAIQMGEQFGISKKVVGKAMAEMSADVSNFGSMGKKHLGATAVYAAKLGIEIKSLSGLFDKFNNFENAAKGAAEMSQAFGMNVDAMDLLKASSPAEIADTIRKSFHEAGNSLEDMDRHQRKLLEAQTGFKGADLEAFLSPENMDMDYDDILAGADEAENKQLTQLQTMKKLTKDIKKEVKSGQHAWEGFGDAFADGFGKGILRSAPMRKLLIDIQKSLRAVHIAGRKVGRAFVEHFPGVKQFITGLSDFFNPERFKKLADGLVRVFTTFFKDLDTDPKKAAESFINNILKLFTDTFSDSGSALSGLKEGFTKFFTAISNIIAGLIPIILKALIKAFTSITQFIIDPGAFLKSMAAGGGAMSKIFQPLVDAFSDPKTKALLNKAWDSFKDMLIAGWDRIKEPVFTVLKWIFAIMIGKAVLFGVVSAAAGIVTGAVMTKGVPAIAKGLGKAFTGVFKGANGARLTKAALDGGKLWGKANGLKVMSSAGKQIYGSAAQAALKKGSAKAIGTGFKGGLKAAAVNIQGSTSRVVGKALSSGPVMKSVAKGAGHMAKGLAIAGKAAFKAIPIIGWAATIGFALYEGVTHGMKVWDRTGEVGKAFSAVGGGIISSLTFGILSPKTGTKIFEAFNFVTVGFMAGIDRFQKGASLKDSLVAAGSQMLGAITFGLVDGDALEDAINGTNRTGKRLADEMVRATQDAYEKGVKNMQPSIDAANKQMAGYIEVYKANTYSLERLSQEMGDKLTGAGKKAIDAMKSMDAEHQKIQEKYDKRNKAIQKVAGEANRMPKAFTTALAKAENYLDSDLVLAFSPEQMAAGMGKEMAKKLQAEFGHGNVQFANNVLTIDKKIYQDQAKKLRSIVEKGGDPEQYKKAIEDNVVAASQEMQATLMKIPLESMLEAKKQAAAAGVSSPVLAKLQQQLSQRVELEEMKKALLKANPNMKLDGENIKAAFDKHVKSLIGVKKREFKVAFDIASDKAQAAIKLAGMSEGDKAEAKLSALEVADGVLARIEKLKGIPKRLEKMRSVMKGISVKDTETAIKEIFVKLGEISDVMKAESAIFGIKSGSIVASMGGVNTGIDAMSEIFTKLDLLMDLPQLKDPKRALAIVKSIQTMKGLIKPAIATVGHVDAFSGGHLVVTHNLPNTNINVTVHLDAKTLGKTVGKVDIGKDNAKGKTYFSTQPMMSTEI